MYDMLVSQLQDEISRCGLSAYRIARMANVDCAQLSKFKHNGKGLSLKSAGRVAEALGLRLMADVAEDDAILDSVS